jgi:putative membrane protein insertion efficiency factor
VATATVVRMAVRLPQYAVMGLIKGYQLVVSPLLGPSCKYYPSCSHYGLEAVRRHGAIRGSLMAGWRVLRCNPWSNGGVDEVPLKGQPIFRTPQTSSVAT